MSLHPSICLPTAHAPHSSTPIHPEKSHPQFTYYLIISDKRRSCDSRLWHSPIQWVFSQGGGSKGPTHIQGFFLPWGRPFLRSVRSHRIAYSRKKPTVLYTIQSIWMRNLIVCRIQTSLLPSFSRFVMLTIYVVWHRSVASLPGSFFTRTVSWHDVFTYKAATEECHDLTRFDTISNVFIAKLFCY